MGTSIVALGIKDLFFRAKIEQIAKSSGISFFEVTDFESIPRIGGGDRAIVVLDLLNSVDRLESISGLESEDIVLIGFYPHIEKTIAEKARNLGIQNVVPRSALEAKLRNLIKEFFHAETEDSYR